MGKKFEVSFDLETDEETDKVGVEEWAIKNLCDRFRTYPIVKHIKVKEKLKWQQ